MEWTGNHQDHKPSQKRSPNSVWNHSPGSQITAQETDTACGWKRSHLTVGLLEKLIKRSRPDSNNSANPTKRQKCSQPDGAQSSQTKHADPTTVDSCPAATSPRGGVAATLMETSLLNPSTKLNSANHSDSSKNRTNNKIDQAGSKDTKTGIPCTADDADANITDGCDKKSAVYPKGTKSIEDVGDSVSDREDNLLLEHKGFCRREQHLIDLEDNEELRSVYVQNDGKCQHMTW